MEAVVLGSEEYNVSMSVDSDGVIHHHRCTCPYDMGEFCKHEVAVLYRLRELRNAAAKQSKAQSIVSILWETL